jgi:hypothetical protein
MNTDALMLTSRFLRSFCLLETAKIDVFTNPSQVKPVDGDARLLVFGDHPDVGRLVEGLRLSMASRYQHPSHVVAEGELDRLLMGLPHSYSPIEQKGPAT